MASQLLYETRPDKLNDDCYVWISVNDLSWLLLYCIILRNECSMISLANIRNMWPSVKTANSCKLLFAIFRFMPCVADSWAHVYLLHIMQFLCVYLCVFVCPGQPGMDWHKRPPYRHHTAASRGPVGLFKARALLVYYIEAILCEKSCPLICLFVQTKLSCLRRRCHCNVLVNVAWLNYCSTIIPVNAGVCIIRYQKMMVYVQARPWRLWLDWSLRSRKTALQLLVSSVLMMLQCCCLSVKLSWMISIYRQLF